MIMVIDICWLAQDLHMYVYIFMHLWIYHICTYVYVYAYTNGYQWHYMVNNHSGVSVRDKDAHHWPYYFGGQKRRSHGRNTTSTTYVLDKLKPLDDSISFFLLVIVKCPICTFLLILKPQFLVKSFFRWIHGWIPWNPEIRGLPHFESTLFPGTA